MWPMQGMREEEDKDSMAGLPQTCTYSTQYALVPRTYALALAATATAGWRVVMTLLVASDVPRQDTSPRAPCTFTSCARWHACTRYSLKSADSLSLSLWSHKVFSSVCVVYVCSVGS